MNIVFLSIYLDLLCFPQHFAGFGVETLHNFCTFYSFLCVVAIVNNILNSATIFLSVLSLLKYVVW